MARGRRGCRNSRVRPGRPPLRRTLESRRYRWSRPPRGPTPAGRPVAVAGTTDSSAILTFAEVDDGLGAPASYDIRVAPTPLVWGGPGQSVTRGTCATPFAGAVIRATRVCSVLGLTAGTQYDFQLVAFPG